MRRDFGSFEIDYQKFIFKHAYYDKSMQYGSKDPGDPKKTNTRPHDHNRGRILRTPSSFGGLVVNLSVAELAAAFLCAALRITDAPRADHAQYLASWLAVLKADKRAMFTAASKATEAAAAAVLIVLRAI